MYENLSTFQCKKLCVALSNSLVLFTHCLTRKHFLLSCNLEAFELINLFFKLPVPQSLQIHKTQSILGNIPKYGHNVVSTAILRSLCVPSKYWEIIIDTLSKFRHFSQHACHNGIFPCNFTCFGLYLYKVANDIHLLVFSDRLYMSSVFFMLVCINLFPAYFLSGTGKEISSEHRCS